MTLTDLLGRGRNYVASLAGAVVMSLGGCGDTINNYGGDGNSEQSNPTGACGDS